jgi:branched-chain amino acid aminotransferase
LFHSLAVLQFEIPKIFTRQYLVDQIMLVINKNQHQKLGRVRLTIDRGDGGLYDLQNNIPKFIIQSWPLNPENNQFNTNGLIIDAYKDASKSCDVFSNIKSNNYLVYAMAALWAKKHYLNDALILNTKGTIADATIANLFIVKDDLVMTPPQSDGIVMGIMRWYLIENLPKINVDVKEVSLNENDVLDADAVFLSNSIYGIKWVKQFQQKSYNPIFVEHIHRKIIKPLVESYK